MDPITDEMLIAAARKRLMDQLAGGGGDSAKIVNNVYGGGGMAGGGGGGGMLESMTGGGGGGEDPFDYFVDIERRDLPEINEATGKPVGWEKRVHRWRGSKKKAPMTPPAGPAAPWDL